MSFKLRPVARNLAVAFGGAASIAVLALPAHAQQTPAQQPQRFDRVEITGSHIRRVDAEGPQPVVTITRDDIERSGKTTLTDLITSLPISSGGSFTEGAGAGNSFAPGTAATSLRGLGTDTVLVLMNGRRLANYGFAQNLDEAFVDLNSIPVSAIERVEILKDGASAIYGSDAIAGVINVILRRDYQGIEVGGMAGSTYEGGGTEYRLNLTAGWGNPASDRWNLMGTFDYFHREEISAKDRDFSFTANQERRGGFNQLSPTGNPGTWSGAATGAPTGFLPFANCPPERITSEILGVPVCSYDFAHDNWLIPKTERIGGFLRGSFDFTQNIGLFGELGYTQNTTNQSAAATPGSFAVPAANPSNPFGAPVTAIYRLLDVGLRLNEIESDNFRGVLGLRGMAAGWDWETAYTYAKNEVTNTGSNYVDIRRVRAAINGGTDPVSGNTYPEFVGQYYNLTNNAANSPAMLQALRYTTTREGESTMKQFDARGTRELWNMAGGAAAIAIGAEYREEDLSDTPDAVSQTNNIVGSGGTSSRGERDNTSAYVEFALPFIRNLEAQLALRYDDYSDFGSTVNPKVALSYRLAPNLLVRGGWGTGFRAPSLVQMYLGSSMSFPNVRDTTRCNAYTAAFGAADPRTTGVCGTPQVRTQFSGNPNLDAEESENIWLGFVWDLTNNLSVAVDYYNIFHEDIVTSPTAAFLVANSALFPGAINRAPQNADDIAAGAPGGLYGTAVTDTLVPGIFRSFFNATEQKTWGYDVDVRYRFNVGGWGQFTTGLFATYMGSLKRQDNPGAELVEYADTYEYPRWKATGSVNWTTGPWSTTVAANYRKSFQQFYGIANGAQYERVGTHTTWDLNVQYTGFRNLTLAVGANNIFDREPPFSDEPWTGYTESIDNPQGGFYYVRANYRFR